MIHQTQLLIAVTTFFFLRVTELLEAVEKISVPDDLSTAKLISPSKGIAGDNPAENFQGSTEKKIDNTNRLKQLLLEIKELRKKYDSPSVDSS